MANKYPLVSNSATKTIQELGVGDTLLVDNLSVTGESNVTGNGSFGGNLAITGNVSVDGSLTVIGNINANLGNVVVENLTVEGLSNLGPVGNITITGGSNNYVLRTDGAGNLNWANIQSEIANAAGANTYVQINNNNLFGASANFRFNTDTNTLFVDGDANIATLNPIVSNLGPAANVKITGGSSGYVLATDGSANLSWVAIDPSVSGDGGNASSSVLLLASLNGGNAISA
jgi:hypothetical protein